MDEYRGRSDSWSYCFNLVVAMGACFGRRHHLVYLVPTLRVLTILEQQLLVSALHPVQARRQEDQMTVNGPPALIICVNLSTLLPCKMLTYFIIGVIIIVIGFNLISLAERRPPSKIHDPHGYKTHREKKAARYVSGCLLILVGAILILTLTGKFLSGE
jgi:hypothetical protein